MDLRRDSMKKRVKERATANRLTQGYLEGGDSDEEGVSLNALKNKYKKGGNKRGGKNDDFETFTKNFIDGCTQCAYITLACFSGTTPIIFLSLIHI